MELSARSTSKASTPTTAPCSSARRSRSAPTSTSPMCWCRTGSSQAEPLLPEDVKRLGVTVRKSLTFPLLLISLTSPNATYNGDFLNNYAAINVIDALARVPGVGQVRLMSGGEYAMRIWVRPDRLATLGITVSDIVNAVKQQNVLTPAGQVGGAPPRPDSNSPIPSGPPTGWPPPKQFGEIVIRTNPDSSQVRLKDVARLELGAQIYSSLGRLNGKPAALIGLYQIPGSNALAVAQQVGASLKQLKARFPEDVDYRISLDTTLPITEGITEITHTLLEAVVLVILVVFLFLQNWRATLIPLLTVPVSLIGDLRGVSAARLLGQHPLDARTGAGHWHRGGRCHRRGRGGDPQHRAWPGARRRRPSRPCRKCRVRSSRSR